MQGRAMQAAAGLAGLAVLLVVAGCGTDAGAPTAGSPPAARTSGATPSTSTRTSATPGPSSTPTESGPASASPPLGTVPPPWLGTRVLPRTASGYGEIRRTPPALRERRFTLPDTVAMLPGTGFASRVERAPASVIARSTWRAGCPVAASDLDWVRLTFRGFDHHRHTGELLVNRDATAALVEVFRRLYAARFPIEEMRITTKAEQTAAPTGDGNDTGAFNCRPTVGSTTYSQHAYGRAIDVDPFQNPYVKGELVLPELASAYLDRGDVRPGMILPGGVVTRAFAAVGWGWGGDYTRLKDLQHFSANGR